MEQFTIKPLISEMCFRFKIYISKIVAETLKKTVYKPVFDRRMKIAADPQLLD
jgi:hypothetical protein